MPHTTRSSPKRKLDDVDGSTPTPPVSDTQTNGDDAKKLKKKCKCPYDGCNASRYSPCKLQEHIDFVHKEIFHNVCGHIDEVTGAKCEYKCARPCDLVSHKRHKHSDVRDHKCTVCLMAFKNAQARDGHWAAKHSPIDDPVRTKYKCTVCNKEFPTRGPCTEHYLRRCAPKDDPGLAAFCARLNKTKRARYASDETVRIKRALRNALKRMMKKMGMGKVSLSEKVVGCSYEELVAHLNDNDRGFVYEKGGVLHIDHIRLMASFKNLECHIEVLECMNFNNLQLLPGPENSRKCDSFTSAGEAAYAISKAGLAIAELKKGWRADGVCKCELCMGQTT
ncbi:hypothetical protein T484DRAFT_1757139 [Baffinella frigidus]|nr:hypothetical protein T484DRAFT_1757139 [Cryptophyta sp. CCMP2293]